MTTYVLVLLWHVYMANDSAAMQEFKSRDACLSAAKYITDNSSGIRALCVPTTGVKP